MHRNPNLPGGLDIEHMNVFATWHTLLVPLAYLLGSISSAVLVSRALGLPDPRSGGSGNPGATNVLRLGGKRAGGLTLAGDVLKGVVPVAVARLLDAPVAVVAATALAAFCGHLFPLFFGFRGGKGVATLFGVLASLGWTLLVGAGLVWLAIAALTRYASLASLLAAYAAAGIALWQDSSGWMLAALALMALLTTWRHAANITRLVNGSESRIGQRATSGTGG